MSDKEEHAQMIADCEARESKLNDWERGFIDSVARRVGWGYGLTEKEIAVLDHIWERVTE